MTLSVQPFVESIASCNCSLRSRRPYFVLGELVNSLCTWCEHLSASPAVPLTHSDHQLQQQNWSNLEAWSLPRLNCPTHLHAVFHFFWTSIGRSHSVSMKYCICCLSVAHASVRCFSIAEDFPKEHSKREHVRFGRETFALQNFWSAPLDREAFGGVDGIGSQEFAESKISNLGYHSVCFVATWDEDIPCRQISV